MKLRRVVGSFVRMPWIPLLDQVTDACEGGASDYLGPVSFLVRPCVKPAIALAWFWGLGQVRVATGALVDRVKIEYYDPREDAIREWWVRWPNRLLLAAGSFAVSYASTFYVYPAIVLPHMSASWLMADDDDDQVEHSSYVSTVSKADWVTGERKEFTLVSKSIIKCSARSTQVAVWVLGTLLRLPPKRFLPLWFASNCVSPLAEGVSESGGNFALWLSMGTVISKMFCLYPNEKEKYLGALGTTAALFATSAMLPSTKKVGRTETVLSATVFILTEVGARYAMFLLKSKMKVLQKKLCKTEEKEHGKETETEKDDSDASGSEKPNMLIRVWRYVTYDKKTSLSSSWPEFSYPSYFEWVGIAAAWSSLGLAIDGV